MTPQLKLAYFVGLFLSANLSAQIDVQWVGRYSSAGNNVDRAKKMVVDAAGNSFVVGTSWNGANYDIVTEKFNTNGVPTWTATYNGTGNAYDEARAIALDPSGNVYVTGYSAGPASNYDIVTIKYNAAGAQQWASRYNGSANGFDEGYDVMADAAGNVYVTGGAEVTSNSTDFMTIKYNAAGAQQWASNYNFSGANIDEAYAMTMDASGNIFVTGYSYTSAANDFDIATIKYNNSGAQQWVSRYNGPGTNFDASTDIALDASGNIFVCGYARGTLSVTDYDAVTIKINAAGAQQWAKTYNGPGNDYDRANAITILPDGNVAITGRSVGTISTAEDMITILYNGISGNEIWNRRYDGGVVNYDEGQAIVPDSSNRLFVTGYSYATGANNNYLTIKYEANGDTSWIVKYNGTGNNADQAYSIAMGMTGEFYVGGMSKGFGTNEDYAVVKYCQLRAIGSNDTSICLGATTQLSASSSYGTIDSVWWTPSTFLNQSNIANPVSTPNTTTTYILHLRNQYGCIDEDTITITVNPLPGPAITSSGPVNFCVGGFVTLTADDTTSTNETYLWNTSDTTASITVSSTGLYSCTITNGSGCSSLSSINVNVNPLPTISAGNDTGLCQSSSIVLCATGGSTYAWTPPFGVSDTTLACPTVGPTSSTTYIVYGTDANGCSSSDTVLVSLYPPPSIPVITQNFSVFTSTSAATYQWYFNSTLIPGATGQSYTATQNGSYYVEITDANGCSAFSAPISINDVSVQEIDVNNPIALYPNPNNGNFIAEFDQDGMKGDISITDLAGKIIFIRSFAAGVNYHGEFSLDLPSGVYFIKVTFEDGAVHTRRMIISE